MPRLSYTDQVHVYTVSTDEDSPEMWVATILNVAMRITQMSNKDDWDFSTGGMVFPEAPTHWGWCDVTELVKGGFDQSLIIRQQDQQNFLVLRTEERDRRRGGKTRYRLTLAQVGPQPIVV